MRFERDLSVTRRTSETLVVQARHCSQVWGAGSSSWPRSRTLVCHSCGHVRIFASEEARKETENLKTLESRWRLTNRSSARPSRRTSAGRSRSQSADGRETVRTLPVQIYAVLHERRHCSPDQKRPVLCSAARGGRSTVITAVIKPGQQWVSSDPTGTNRRRRNRPEILYFRPVFVCPVGLQNLHPRFKSGRRLQNS